MLFQLQEAFAAGLLKPGLNRMFSKVDKKYENDVQAMKQKIEELVAEVGHKAPWIERLDLVMTCPIMYFTFEFKSYCQMLRGVTRPQF